LRRVRTVESTFALPDRQTDLARVPVTGRAGVDTPASGVSPGFFGV
jgi:hypothetical protein